MAQLERITEYITQQAEAETKEIMSRAQAEYDKTITQAQAEGKKEYERAVAKAQEQAESKRRLARSASAQKNAMNLLQVKIDAVERTLQLAKKMVLSLGDEEYMGKMEAILDQYATRSGQEGSFFSKLLQKLEGESKGEILFNERDLKRLPSFFTAKIAKYNLELSKEPASIDGGFILRYGKIEENCSIGALIREKRESLTDQISKKLF